VGGRFAAEYYVPVAGTTKTFGRKAAADAKSIRRRFEFKGFYKTMGFVNAMAWVANAENHHPDFSTGYNYCDVTFTTHAIDGLSENDFICAAKINALL
jgi:4a-hydroxytetrahydrobiopterin dehydratase